MAFLPTDDDTGTIPGMPQRKPLPTKLPTPPKPGTKPRGTTTSSTSSQMPAESQRLSRNYEDYIKSLQGNTGTAMETAMAKIRDAREGGMRALTEGAGARGIASTPGIQKYEEGTQAEMARAATDIGLGREAMIGEAMRGATGVYESPYRLAQAEKGIGLQAQGLNLQRETTQAAAQEAARQREFDNFMALLNAQRSSSVPLPTNDNFLVHDGRPDSGWSGGLGAGAEPVPTRRTGGFGGRSGGRRF